MSAGKNRSSRSRAGVTTSTSWMHKSIVVGVVLWLVTLWRLTARQTRQHADAGLRELDIRPPEDASREFRWVRWWWDEGVRRREERQALKEFGFWRAGTRLTRYAFPLISIIMLFVVVSFAFAYDRRHNFDSNLTTAAAPLALTIAVTFVGIYQWRAVRNETALDKFYDRLEANNRKLDEWPSARQFAGPWPDQDSPDEKRSRAGYEKQMYVYRELDSLEQALAKYRIGFMSAENARRSLRTFQARCSVSKEFCDMAMKCVRHNEGYQYETRVVVWKCCERAERDRSKASSS